MAKKVIRGVGAGRWYSPRRIRRRAEQPVQFRRFKALLVALFGGAGGLMEFVDESERVGQCYRCGSARRAFTPA
jgi:hypothetical protein